MYKQLIFPDELTRLFTFGGYNSEGDTDVELYDLSGTSCEQPRQLPFPVYSAAWMKSSDGNPLVCSGTSGLSGGCLEYIPSDNGWYNPGYYLNGARPLSPAAAEISGGRWWIIGGNGEAVRQKNHEIS